MINNIKLNVRFKDYQFRRAKMMGNNTVLYTSPQWVGKNVSIIPVPITVTDRLIEKCYDKQLEWYEMCIETNWIYNKKVAKGGGVGRVYVPNHLVGLDCLIIETPKLDNF